MQRSSTVIWNGAGKEGSGRISTQSGALSNATYAWGTRFKEEHGTSPEELIAAAHAGCFTMQLSFLIQEAGFTSEEIKTTCTISMKDKVINESHLVVRADVPGMSKEMFLECAEKAREGCPVSKALNMDITMDASLESLATV